MATRAISDPKARMITILIAPLMSCSARLPVYLLLIGAFIEPRYGPGAAGATLFAMHFVGTLVAAPLSWILNKTLTKKVPPEPFLMELPPYRAPRIWTTLWRVYESGKDFVIRAGTVILAMTVIIWTLLYFPRPVELKQQIADEYPEELKEVLEQHIDAAYLEQSYIRGKFPQMHLVIHSSNASI